MANEEEGSHSRDVALGHTMRGE